MVKHGTGNWQTRHQALQARRKAAKLRKQQSDDLKDHRRAVQACLAGLERVDGGNAQGSTSNSSLYLWVTKPPCDESQQLDNSTRDNGESFSSSSFSLSSRANNKQRPRSVSLCEAPPPSTPRSGGGGGRRRSQSFGEKLPRHPRSKEQDNINNVSTNSTSSTAETTRLVMCQGHFFYGRCSRGKKKQACAYAHLPTDTAEALCRFVVVDKSATVLLQQAQQALPDLPQQPGAMPALYLLQYHHVDNDDMQVGEWLTTTRHQLNFAHVQYMVHQGRLVFDAHQMTAACTNNENNNGMVNQLASQKDVSASSSSNNNNNNNNNTTKTTSHDNVDIHDDNFAAIIVQGLPTILLEHVLAYLPAAAAGCLAQVCQSWRLELQTSRHLWQSLLQRYNWPMASSSSTSSSSLPLPDKETTASQRQAFVAHFTVFKEMRALSQGLVQVLRGRNASVGANINNRSLAVYQGQQQRSSSVAIAADNAGSLHLQPWSAAKVLMGHGDDCTLRLLETVTKADGSGDKHCRELVRHNVDIYRNTKRKKSTLVSMTLDDDSIGCLCRVVVGTDSSTSSLGSNVEHLLVVMLREDFLIQDESASDSAMQVMDVREMVLNYLVTLEEEDDVAATRRREFSQGLGLRDFLSFGGDLDEVEVFCSDTLVCCGSQCYLLEASISYAGPEDDSISTMDRRLFVISTALEGIVWMGNHAAHIPSSLPWLHAGSLSLTHARTEKGCSFAVSDGSWLYMGPKIRTNAVGMCTVEEPAQVKQLHDGGRRWEGKVHTAITKSYLLRAGRVPEDNENGSQDEDSLEISVGQMHVDIHSLGEDEAVNTHSSVTLSHVHEIVKIGFLKNEQYAFLVCWCSTEMPHMRLEAIILHLESGGREIGRVSLPKGAELPEIVGSFDTLAAGYRGSGGGLVMTGNAVRDAPVDKSMRTMKKKEKSKRRRNGKQKDGFQRGKSLFG